MTQHLWNHNDTCISILGFYVGTDPTNVLKEEIEECIHQQNFW